LSNVVGRAARQKKYRKKIEDEDKNNLVASAGSSNATRIPLLSFGGRPRMEENQPALLNAT